MRSSIKYASQCLLTVVKHLVISMNLMLLRLDFNLRSFVLRRRTRVESRVYVISSNIKFIHGAHIVSVALLGELDVLVVLVIVFNLLGCERVLQVDSVKSSILVLLCL